MLAGRSACNQPAAHAGTPQLATLGGARDWTLRHATSASSTQRAAQSVGGWKVILFHDSENLMLRPLPAHQSISCSSTSPPPPYSFEVNAQRAVVRNIVAKCFCDINNEAPSDDFVDSVIRSKFSGAARAGPSTPPLARSPFSGSETPRRVTWWTFEGWNLSQPC